MAFHSLDYPIYAASFDPHNSDFLFVAGGGGEGRSGVPNKISLLDTSNAVSKDELREVTHIDLSRDEDSVSSLAVAQASEAEAVVLAGINSSQKDQDAGKNEHLRSIKVPLPPRRTAPDSTATATTIPPPASALTKAALFTPSDAKQKETYQRVLCVSPATKTSNKRLGAVATGLAPVGEVVLFDASRPTPSNTDIVQRITVGRGQEPGDVDILDDGDSQYRVAYCTDTNLYCVDVNTDKKSKDKPSEPFVVFEGSKRDGAFRSLRFLTKSLVLLVRNFPRKKGAQIMIVQIPNEPGQGRPIFVTALPKGFSAATALDVAILPALEDSEKRQFLIATSGMNGVIMLYTLDYTPNQHRRLNFQKHSMFRDIHPAGITCLAFSKFPTPTSEISSKPVRVKLASTSFGNTVVVHTLPLKPRPSPRKANHMVLATPVQRSMIDEAASFFSGAIIIALVSILVYALGELTGNIKHERLGIRTWAPPEVKAFFKIPLDPESSSSTVNVPVIASSMPPLEPAAAARAASKAAEKAAASVVPKIEEITQHIPQVAAAAADKAQGKVEQAAGRAGQGHEQKVMNAKTDEHGADAAHQKINSILKAHQEGQEKDDGDEAEDNAAPAAVMFKDSPHGLSFSTHEHQDHPEEAGAKKWEDLSKQQQHLWRKRLVQAGHLVEGQTEGVLKGVFFGTIAGLVGAAVHG